MTKKFLFIISCIFMFSLTGCSKQVEDMVSNEINEKYLCETVLDKQWQNKEYAYNQYETILCYFNNEKTVAYVITEKGEEYLPLKDKKLDEDGYGIKYNFSSKSDEVYSLYVTVDKENKENISYKWTDPKGNSQELDSKIYTKKECENIIKNTINDVELNNLISSEFKQSSNLSLDKVGAEINSAREAIYEKTKENKKDVYYVYCPSGVSQGKDNILDDYYVFKAVSLDENGEMLTISDYYLLVKKSDYSLYDYKEISENEFIKTEHVIDTPNENNSSQGDSTNQGQENSSQDNSSNEDNSSQENSSSTKGKSKYTLEEIRKKYADDVASGGLVHAKVENHTKVINGELCYYIMYGWENNMGPVDRYGYISSYSLEIYQGEY